MANAIAEGTQIIGGVDTHQDLHTAAIVDLDGAVLGTESFSTTRAGYRAMLRWFRSHGELLRVGVESTGTYGAGITRHLALSGVPVLEVTGPDRAGRRAKGKSDTLDLNDEIAELDRFIGPLVEELAPNLLELEGVGIENAGELMVAAGENLDRLRSEASFAMMCGACPIRASSGQTQRHRLNRGGNRQANSALHMVVICRMRTDQRTRAYVARRTQEGLSKREVMRCLKRYVAREIYRVLTASTNT